MFSSSLSIRRLCSTKARSAVELRAVFYKMGRRLQQLGWLGKRSIIGILFAEETQPATRLGGGEGVRSMIIGRCKRAFGGESIESCHETVHGRQSSRGPKVMCVRVFSTKAMHTAL